MNQSLTSDSHVVTSLWPVISHHSGLALLRLRGNAILSIWAWPLPTHISSSYASSSELAIGLGWVFEDEPLSKCILGDPWIGLNFNHPLDISLFIKVTPE